MKLKEFIKNKTIFICGYSYKKWILKELNNDSNIYDVKFFSLKEFMNHYYFSYDDLTLAYVMEKYQLSYETADIYLNKLVYINDDSEIEQLHFLYELKSDLLEQNLLYFDKDFKSIVVNYNIVFVGIPYFSKLELKTISELKAVTDVSFVCDDVVEKKQNVYSAPSIDSEIAFVCNGISDLLRHGVDINRIKITNVDNDYLTVISKIFGLYQIPIDIDKHYLYSLELANDFLTWYDEVDIGDVILRLRCKYSDCDGILNKIINILNDYVLISNKDIKKEFIIQAMKRTNIVPKKNNSVQVIDFLNDYIDSDDYVFLINFNQNAIPKFKKDEDYITDSMKKGLDIDLVSEENLKIKQSIKRRLSSISNLVITYKNQTPYRSFYPSSLISLMGFSVLQVDSLKTSYSEVWSKLQLADMIFNLVTYGGVSDGLSLYYHNFEIDYLGYDNKFSGVSLPKDQEVVLSYSSMNKYYLCKFQYYIANVLKLDVFLETFATYIGNLFHYVLQHHFMEGKSVDELVNIYTKDQPYKNSKERFFVNKLINNMDFVVSSIEEQMRFCKLNKALYEERVVISLDGDVKVTFKGFIDKILYEEKDGRTIVAIIDYKTGNTDIDLLLSRYGLSLQLPVYLYLAKNSEKLKNIAFAGFYLQKVLNEIPNVDVKNSYESILKKSLRLSGYSNDNGDILSEFDSSYKDSNVISSMKVKNDGSYYSYSKVLNDFQFDSLIDLVHDKVKEAGIGISSGDFAINPKRVNGVNLGCQFCKFRDICFMTEEDVVDIEKDKDLSFIGGDVNA